MGRPRDTSCYFIDVPYWVFLGIPIRNLGSTPMESKQQTTNGRSKLTHGTRTEGSTYATNKTEPNTRRRKKRPSWQLSRRNEKEQLLLPTNANIVQNESSNNNKQQQTPTKSTGPRLLFQRLMESKKSNYACNGTQRPRRPNQSSSLIDGRQKLGHRRRIRKCTTENPQQKRTASVANGELNIRQQRARRYE